MWTRRDLKAKGKATFKANYWKTVFVALILAIACGGGAYSAGGMPSNPAVGESLMADGITSVGAVEDGTAADASDGAIADTAAVADGKTARENASASDADLASTNDGSATGTTDGLTDEERSLLLRSLLYAGIIIGVVVVAFAILLQAFVANPVEVGVRRFFVRNLNDAARVKEVAFGFDHSYLNIVKTMILRDVFIFLWMLVLVVPGIVKLYQYRMVSYLLTEKPDMAWREALDESRRMMQGQKWRTFVLDLSFIGWEILSIPTFGLLSVLYVEPYRGMTNAALFEALRYGEGMPAAAEIPAA
ncbi:DUF975 family protein [Slackia exigua]|uniref:DUF975 family protein n=1 Tax=Slackia exigua TaxID=84109 RepID=UPI00254C9661|nr:DUF975 family protein [Slackia exigua]MDK7724398.1 DUF975 family protein [Slackia exigua]MDK7725726.1 DUF975 family protein [Slackia exigua]